VQARYVKLFYGEDVLKLLQSDEGDEGVPED
jgi:hypothetical protein